MELIALGAIVVSSIGLALAGSLAILSGMLCLAMRPISESNLLNMQTQEKAGL